MKPLVFGSVCSGIEAASVAWEPLGMKARWLAEIEPYCCELLHFYYGASRPVHMPDPDAVVIPDGPDEDILSAHQERKDRIAAIKAVKVIPKHGKTVNHGDIMQVDTFALDSVDVLVGGTPCQAFSIAGLRGGLTDARGNLTLRFVEIADAIRPVRILWENVPGVLSDKTNAFGCLLGALVGANSPLVPGRGQRWTRAGVVDGPVRSAAWRIADAQYFGLAQRRERVFVVAGSGDGAHSAEVLFDRSGVQRHSPPRREAGERTAGTLSARTQGGGGLGTDFDLGGGSYQLSPALTGSGRGVERTGESRGQDCVVPVHVTPPLTQNPYGDNESREGCLIPVELSNGHISHCLNAGGMGRIDYETETLVTHALRAAPVAFRTSPNEGAYETGDRIDALTTGTDPTSHVIAFSCKDSGSDAGEVSPTLRAMEFDKSHANGGGQVAVCMTGHISHSLTTRSAAEEDGTGRGCPIVAHPDTLAFNLRGREGGAMPEVSDVASLRSADGGSSRSYIAQPWAVRRLTPIETAKLQGFPPTYCHIPRKPRKIDQDEAEHYLSHGIEAYLDGEQWMTKAAADGVIYRAHGNSMAVNVMRWLGQRIVWSLREGGTRRLSAPPKIITK